MYGFLQPTRCALSLEDRQNYRQMYCGQCTALQRLFGYPWRALVSYDAAFLGLLLAAQEETPSSLAKAWCAMFPRKVAVAAAEERASLFAAAMAVSIFSLKCEDDLEEGRSSWRNRIARIGVQKIRKSRELLDSLDFPVKLFDVSARQERVERALNREIRDYAEPSARFLAETFRWTAMATGNPENEEALYTIGYHTGRLIYLADGCIDILDDLEKKEFNALMAAGNADGWTFSQKAHSEVVAMAMESLEQIRTLAKGLQLRRYKGLIENVLIHGFPGTIHKRITKSIRRLEKERPLLLRYLPHTALASALCLFTVQNAEAAGWVWGKKYEHSMGDLVYGLTCASGIAGDCPICQWIDCLINPCVCFTGEYWCCQIPKIAVSGYFAFMGIQGIQKKGEERRKRFVAEGETRRRREAEELRKRKQQEEEQRIKQNGEYMHAATAPLNSLISFFNNYPEHMGQDVIPVNMLTKIEQFNFNSHQNEYLSECTELKQIIREKEAELQEIKSKFEDAMVIHKRALNIYAPVEKAVKNAGNLPLIKELDFDHAELTSDNMKCLLADWRWDDFKEVVQAFIDYMERLCALAQMKVQSHE